MVAGRGSKREAIRQFVRQSIAAEFTVADVRRAAPAASQSYISKTLASMRDEGLIEPIGARRAVAATSEASSEPSRRGQRHDAAAADREGSELERGEDIVVLQVRIVGEQLVDRHAS